MIPLGINPFPNVVPGVIPSGSSYSHLHLLYISLQVVLVQLSVQLFDLSSLDLVHYVFHTVSKEVEICLRDILMLGRLLNFDGFLTTFLQEILPISYESDACFPSDRALLHLEL